MTSSSMPLTILAEVTFLLAIYIRGMGRKAEKYEIIVSLPPFGGDDPYVERLSGNRPYARYARDCEHLYLL